MNTKKIIKSLKELNDKLKQQYMREQIRNSHYNHMINELIYYLKEQINQCPLTGNNENDMYYIGKMRAYQEILSKIENK